VTEPGRPAAEEDLYAYVDSALDDEPRTVDRYLQAHPEAAERVAVYRAQRQKLRTAFAAPSRAEPLSAGAFR
jgi:anti-sigma factor RsiW